MRDKGIRYGLIGGILGTLAMDIVMLAVFSALGMPASTFFSFIGEAAGRPLSNLGISLRNGTALGAALHYLIGPVLGVSFGALFSRFSYLRVSGLGVAILLGIITTEIVSVILLVPAVMILEMPRAEIVGLFCLATIFHLIYGAVLGSVVGYGLRNQPNSATS